MDQIKEQKSSVSVELLELRKGPFPVDNNSMKSFVQAVREKVNIMCCILS